MKNTVLFSLIFSLLFGLNSLSPVFGQSSQTTQEKRIEKIKNKIIKASEKRDTIKVKLYSGTTYQGSVSRTTDTNFIIVDASGNSHSVNYEDVNSVGGKGLSSGMKIAIGAAIGAGAVLAVLGIIIASDN